MAIALTNIIWGVIAIFGLLRKVAMQKRPRAASAAHSFCGKDVAAGSNRQA